MDPFSGKPAAFSPLAWLVEVALDRSRRVPALLIVAYFSGVAGLGVAFFGNAGGVDDPHTTVGIVLLALSFLCLFAASLSIRGAVDPTD